VSGDVIPHPRRPHDRRWRILTGFDTNRAELQSEHRHWLAGFAASQIRAGQYAWLRGMASHLGETAANQHLSERRAAAVRDFLVNHCGVPEERITGSGGVGESWSDGGERDDSVRWRAVEVIITNNVVELPGMRVTGRAPSGRVFWIKYMGGGGGGEVIGGEAVIFLIRMQGDYWQRYMYVGGGATVGAPIAWAEALPRGQGWVRFTTTGEVRLDQFVGHAGVDQIFAQVGPASVGRFSMRIPLVHHRITLNTGSGFSLGASSTGGRMMTAGDIEQSQGWQFY
jgi:hypothetical protein